MKIIKPYFEFVGEIYPEQMLKNIEAAGRTCYRSEGAGTNSSAEGFIAKILKRGHESVIEHEKITVRMICDRGVTHELVRHRIASYSQESTRYCNYAKDKFGKELTFIEPCFFKQDSKGYKMWEETCKQIEETYLQMIDSGITPEQARTILPNSLRTEIVVTMNLREWRHYFKLRTSKEAHPQIREISLIMLDEFRRLLPVIFNDIKQEVTI